MPGYNQWNIECNIVDYIYIDIHILNIIYIYIIIYGEFLGPVQIEWIFVFFFCQQYSNVGFYL